VDLYSAFSWTNL